MGPGTDDYILIMIFYYDFLKIKIPVPLIIKLTILHNLVWRLSKYTHTDR